ncbi:MAG TPA: PHP domain-containing protein, partial [Chthonomonadales bacterium]|nr:PHP domain-containing protein [Chthonomonadales bacterium]
LAVSKRGAKRRLVSLHGGISAHISDPDEFASSLLYATGSPGHLAQLEVYAHIEGFALSATGLRRNRKPIPVADETELYSLLGMSYIEPELREGAGETRLARNDHLPQLVTVGDIRGILHSHTTESDGSETLETMANAARERGYQYYGVADHSKLAVYANGLSEERALRQQNQIEALNRRYEAQGSGFRVFKGTECDILADGELDYSDDLLSKFDYVVASVHSRFKLSGEDQTKRIVRAVSNPWVTILGHPTGRLLLAREGYNVQVSAVLEACAKHGVAVEINANSHRLDLDWRWHETALELGCDFSIDTDEHSIGELDNIRWGVMIARKGGVPAERIQVCRTQERLAAAFEERKARAVSMQR